MLQEILLARDIIMYCGKDRISWLDVTSFLSEVERNRSATNSFGASMVTQPEAPLDSTAFKLYKQKKASGYLQEANLQSLLERFGKSLCADIQDRLYEFLGLPNDCQDGHTLRVDYSENGQLYSTD